MPVVTHELLENAQTCEKPYVRGVRGDTGIEGTAIARVLFERARAPILQHAGTFQAVATCGQHACMQSLLLMHELPWQRGADLSAFAFRDLVEMS
jgi:hypothetical protein